MYLTNIKLESWDPFRTINIYYFHLSDKEWSHSDLRCSEVIPNCFLYSYSSAISLNLNIKLVHRSILMCKSSLSSSCVVLAGGKVYMWHCSRGLFSFVFHSIFQFVFDIYLEPVLIPNVPYTNGGKLPSVELMLYSKTHWTN